MATYLIDRGFRRYEFGYGSAVAVILFAICFAFALLYQRFALRRDTAGAVTRIAGGVTTTGVCAAPRARPATYLAALVDRRRSPSCPLFYVVIGGLPHHRPSSTTTPTALPDPCVCGATTQAMHHAPARSGACSPTAR